MRKPVLLLDTVQSKNRAKVVAMTLIQTLVTPNHILQISDRRLTRGDGTIFADSHNKAVSWCGELAIGFTGLAFIDRAQRKPVSEWIAETLCDVTDVEDGVEKLRKGAEDAIARLPASWPDKRLTIVMTGFFNDPAGLRLSVTYKISNFEQRDKIWPRHQPAFFRTIYHDPTSANVMYYVTAGASLDLWHQRVINKRIFSVAAREPQDVNRLARLMVALQRHVSGSNGTVGTDAMVISLPKDPVSRGMILTQIDSIELNTDAAMFSYMADGGFVPERFGPHWICGGTAFADVKGEQIGDNPDDQSISVRILRISTGPTESLEETTS
ncbi:hypothetical protein [Nocardia fluminea]|uniref:hypothetical protein n=1 Tax=Nocardia fluminea TaxID=134984 RepID=UPI0034456C8A